MISLIVFISLILAHQINFHSESNLLADLNNFYSFTTQDHYDFNSKDSRFISNTAYMASIPKGTLLYHRTGIDPSFHSGEWENKTALWFCFVPEHCLFNSKNSDQKIITYQVIEDIDHLIYFSGKNAWMDQFSPMQAFVEGKISEFPFEDHKQFCQLDNRPNGWVTTHWWFEIALCNRGFPSYLKVVEMKDIIVPRKMFFGLGIKDPEFLNGFEINQYVDIYYSTLTILNPNYYYNKTWSNNLPGQNVTKKDIISFHQRTNELLASDCWQEFKKFHTFEMKARTSLKFWIQQLHFVMAKLSSPLPLDLKLQIFIQNQAYLQTLLISLPLNQLDDLFLSYFTADNNQCNQQLEDTLNTVYQSTKYYLSYLKKELKELVVLEYDQPEFNLDKSHLLIQQKIKHTYY